jgi:hypothetical protein
MDLFQAIGRADDGFLLECESRKRPIPIIAGAISAAACIIIVLSLVLSGISSPTVSTDTLDGAPSIIVDGQTYLVSSHGVIYDVCPEGFEYAGILSDGEMAGCEYYVNQNIPQLIYVYQLTGYTDSNGEYLYKYVSYVREDVRGLDLVMYNGRLYTTMYSSRSDTSEYESVRSKYGYTIEGGVPDGFEYVGSTVFCGYDLIPDTEFGSNCHQAAADIYANAEESGVILISTHWYTATREEGTQTRHNGYDVYIAISDGN